MSTTRGALRFGSATVSVLLTQHGDGQTIGTAVVELRSKDKATNEPYHRITAATPKEAWSALALWIGQVIA